MRKSTCHAEKGLSKWAFSLLLLGLFTLTLPLLSQSQTLRNGKVTEEDTKEPLAGATVTVKGSSKATLTNADGIYSISTKDDDILVFSNVGAESVEIRAGNRSVINIALKRVTTSGDEVVVTGYQTLRKSNFTGSVAMIKGEDLQKAPVANFAQALEGRVPGLQVQFQDGQPGETPTFLMRGPNSLNNSPQPLFVIDGFQLESFNPASLSMDDIESISFLKDASSVALYGARAANGVVVITTKKGRMSRPQITFGASYGFNSNRKTMELMGVYDYLKVNDAFVSDPTFRAFLNRYYDGGKTLEDYKDVKSVDFQDIMFTKGKQQRYNVSMRGGNDVTKYLISGNYFDGEGSIVFTGSKAYNARIVLDNNITSKLRVNLMADYSTTIRSGPYVREGNGTSAYGTSTTLMYRMWAWRPYPFPDEDMEEFTYGTADDGAITTSDLRVNPYNDYKNQKIKNAVNGFNGSITVNYDIRKNLLFKSTFTDRFTLNDYEYFYNELTSPGMYRSGVNEGGPWGGYLKYKTNSYINENSLTYNPNLGMNHKLTLLGVQGLQSNTTQGMGYTTNYLTFPQLGLPGVDDNTAPTVRSLTSNRTDDSRVWFLGIVNYSYLQKYIASASLRSEGSSKFYQGNRWGYYPSFSLAWNMEKENFLKESAAISTSKLRFAYGTAGNDRIPAYTPYDKMSFSNGSYPFADHIITGGSVVNTSPSNTKLKWETTYSMDLGYELGLFKDYVKLEATVYKKVTKNLLFNAFLPYSTGYTTAWKNIGSLENKGLEIELNTINIKKKDFEWRTNFNISFNKNRIIALDDNRRSMLYSSFFESNFGNLWIEKVGQPTGMMIGYTFDGLYQLSDFYNPGPGVYVLKEGIPINNPNTAVAPGYPKYKDLNGDGKIDAGDLGIIGRGQPIHIGGFTNNFRYKRLTISTLLSWVYGNNIYNANRHTFEGNSNVRPLINQFASYLNRWTVDNQNTDIQVASRATAGKAGYYTSQYVEDGSFLRLKTVNIDYALPALWVKKAGFASLNIFVSGQNLLTWTKYSGLDPQVSIAANQVLGPGLDYSAYPPARTFTFGIKGVF